MPFFGYEKRSNSKIISLLKILQVNYIKISPLLLTKSHLTTAKSPFFFGFLCIKIIKHKIHFLVTKSGRNLNMMTFSDPPHKIFVFFISQFFFQWNSFLVGSHGFRGLFGAFCVAWNVQLSFQKTAALRNIIFCSI